MLALARKPGPNSPSRLLMPSASRMGPFSTIKMLGELVEDAAILTKLRSSSSVRSAVTSTGKYSAWQPAITALAAAFSEVMTRLPHIQVEQLLLARQPGDREHLPHLVIGWRHDGQPVRPPQAKTFLNGLNGIGGFNVAFALLVIIIS